MKFTQAGRAALLVVTNLHAVEERWAHAGRASIYLKDNASQEEVGAFKEALTRVPGVTSVRYVSSGTARAEFGRFYVGIVADIDEVVAEVGLS